MALEGGKEALEIHLVVLVEVFLDLMEEGINFLNQQLVLEVEFLANANVVLLNLRHIFDQFRLPHHRRFFLCFSLLPLYSRVRNSLLRLDLFFENAHLFEDVGVFLVGFGFVEFQRDVVLEGLRGAEESEVGECVAASILFFLDS